MTGLDWFFHKRVFNAASIGFLSWILKKFYDCSFKPKLNYCNFWFNLIFFINSTWSFGNYWFNICLIQPFIFFPISLRQSCWFMYIWYKCMYGRYKFNNLKLSKWIWRVRLNDCVCYVVWHHLVFNDWIGLWAKLIFTKKNWLNTLWDTTSPQRCSVTNLPELQYFHKEPIFTKKSTN